MIKEFIIKLFGGFTKTEIDIVNCKFIKAVKDSYRKGDLVYINDDRFKPLAQYYLLDYYNGKNCWYVSTDKDDAQRREILNGVGFEKLSIKPIDICPCCNKVI